MSTTIYKQGDIVVLPFPYSDLTEAKRRPALIVSNAKLNQSEDCLLCLITSQKGDGALLIDAYASGSLPVDSYVKPQRLFTAANKIIMKKVAVAHPSVQKAVFSKLSELLEIR